MEQSSPDPNEAAGSVSTRRFGYFVSAVFNGVLIWVAHNLLDWEFPPFLTESFNDALPAITASLVVAIIANGLRIVYPAAWFVASTEVLVLVANFYATVALWRAFPFDFTDYTVRWDLLVRGVLIIVLLATVLAIVVQVIKTLRTFGSTTSAL